MLAGCLVEMPEPLVHGPLHLCKLTHAWWLPYTRNLSAKREEMVETLQVVPSPVKSTTTEKGRLLLSPAHCL